jgi:hypothetical protein
MRFGWRTERRFRRDPCRITSIERLAGRMGDPLTRDGGQCTVRAAMRLEGDRAVRQGTRFDDLVELAEGVYEAACESAVDWTEGLGAYVLVITGQAESLACAPLGLPPDWDESHLMNALRPLVGGRVSGTILCAALPEATAASGRDARRVMVLLKTREGGRWMRQAIYAQLDDGIVRTGEWNNDLRQAPTWIRAYWEGEIF